jgi:hypothetical protein
MRFHCIAGVVLVLLIVACGSGNGNENNGSGTAVDTVDTDNGEDDEIDSVRWGPDDPPIPGEYAAFAADSADGLACDSIDDRAQGDDFWTVAAEVCRVFAGEGDWPEVEAVPPPSSEGNPYERCLSGELFEMLKRALAWHDEHPGQSPEVNYPSSGIHSPCQRRLYDVGAEVGAGLGDGCQNGEPVPTPGVPVRISAPGILGFANPRATVDGELLCVINGSDEEDNALRTFQVVVPTSGEEKTVTIEVETNYGILDEDVKLPAVEVEATETSGETTETSGETTETSETSVETTDDATSTHDAPGTTDGP